jgi:4-amino-4-deoxy-L-arabinose transferase-like glycosyltransferase
MQGVGAVRRLQMRYQWFAMRPATWVAALATVQIVIWTALPYSLAVSLPLDIVSDGLAWGHEWQFGYYKHPPLASWLVEIFFVSFGDVGPFLLSQLCVAATYVLVFLLGREMMPASWAAVGTLLLAGVYYFSIPTPEFNHNVAQMPIWVGAAFCYLSAIKGRSLPWWFALGVVAGLGLLTKYQCFLLFIALGIHFVATRSARDALSSPGPYLAVIVALVVISPHLVWLADHDFSPFEYARDRAGQAKDWIDWLRAPIQFLLSQVLVVLPVIIVAVVVRLVSSKTFRSAPDWRDEATRFLLIVGLGPMALAAAWSLATGLGLRSMWGAPMCSLFGLLLIQLSRASAPRVSLKRLYQCIAILFVLLPFGYVIATDCGPRLRHERSRTLWPDRALAQTLGVAWSQATDCPLRIVAGDSWLAGLVAMRSDSRPSVLIDGDARKSPWITARRFREEGALLVWQAGKRPAAAAALMALPGAKAMGHAQFSWPRRKDLPPLQIGWGVVSPAAACDSRS